MSDKIIQILGTIVAGVIVACALSILIALTIRATSSLL
jgi:hypothetical protein